MMLMVLIIITIMVISGAGRSLAAAGLARRLGPGRQDGGVHHKGSPVKFANSDQVRYRLSVQTPLTEGGKGLRVSFAQRIGATRRPSRAVAPQNKAEKYLGIEHGGITAGSLELAGRGIGRLAGLNRRWRFYRYGPGGARPRVEKRTLFSAAFLNGQSQSFLLSIAR